MLFNALTSLRERGFTEMTHNLLHRAARSVAPEAFRRSINAKLLDLGTSGEVFVSAEHLIETLGASSADMRTVRSEFDELQGRLQQRVASRKLCYPSHYGIQPQSSLLIYALVRLSRPLSVLVLAAE